MARLVVVCHPDQEQYGEAVVERLGDAVLRTSADLQRGQLYVMNPGKVWIDGEPLDPDSII